MFRVSNISNITVMLQHYYIILCVCVAYDSGYVRILQDLVDSKYLVDHQTEK